MFNYSGDINDPHSPHSPFKSCYESSLVRAKLAKRRKQRLANKKTRTDKTHPCQHKRRYWKDMVRIERDYGSPTIFCGVTRATRATPRTSKPRTLINGSNTILDDGIVIDRGSCSSFQNKKLAKKKNPNSDLILIKNSAFRGEYRRRATKDGSLSWISGHRTRILESKYTRVKKKKKPLKIWVLRFSNNYHTGPWVTFRLWWTRLTDDPVSDYKQFCQTKWKKLRKIRQGDILQISYGSL